MSKKDRRRYYCPICGNKDKNLFFNIKNKLVCRKCLEFKNKKKIKNTFSSENNYKYKINYKLTQEQEKASDFIVTNINKNNNVAISAVCGAGKTEIILKVISSSLKSKKKIGISTPRKDIVIDLKTKLDKIFSFAEIEAIYGGSKKNLKADIFIFTTHQLYNFKKYFDILIIDEIDAFPFFNNEVLINFMKRACKGNYIFLSATMPQIIENFKKIKKFYITRRFHNYPLPIPIFKRVLFYKYEINNFINKHENKVLLVFFPTISLLERMSKKIKNKKIIFHSKIKDKENIFKRILTLKKGVVFTTTILERGITIKGCQVLVVNANHYIFNKETLIQISGRVGRKQSEPNGEILLIDKKRKEKKLRKVINILNGYNK